MRVEARLPGVRRSPFGASSRSVSIRSWSALAREACEGVTGTAYELPSGALHDAASMAPHLPTTMVFSPSIAGISHAPEEDTAEPDLKVAIEAFGDLVERRITTAS